MTTINEAHVHYSFFAKSASFIYQIINNLKYFRLLFIVWEFQSRRQFPLLPINYYSLTTKQKIWHRSWKHFIIVKMKSRSKSFYDSLIFNHYGNEK